MEFVIEFASELEKFEEHRTEVIVYVFYAYTYSEISGTCSVIKLFLRLRENLSGDVRCDC